VFPADFYVFIGLQPNGRDGAFCGTTGIIKNAMIELKRLPQNGLQKCFQHCDSRWQKCIAAKEGYFEGNAASIMALFVFLRNKVIRETF
jgi:hypothetical protein